MATATHVCDLPDPARVGPQELITAVSTARVAVLVAAVQLILLIVCRMPYAFPVFRSFAHAAMRVGPKVLSLVFAILCRGQAGTLSQGNLFASRHIQPALLPGFAFGHLAFGSLVYMVSWRDTTVQKHATKSATWQLWVPLDCSVKHVPATVVVLLRFVHVCHLCRCLCRGMSYLSWWNGCCCHIPGPFIKQQTLLHRHPWGCNWQ